MLDPRTLVQNLEGVVKILCDYRCHAAAQDVRDAIAMISTRQTPEPITVARAVEVLNEIEFDTVDDWKEKNGDDGERWVESEWACVGFPSWAAIAIVEAYLARKGGRE